MCFGFGAVVFFYNVFCVYVTFLLDSIWHAILDNFRPVGRLSELHLLNSLLVQVCVWAVDLLLYYVITNGAFGETWGVWSWLELAGMILLFYGTAVYNGKVCDLH